MPVRRSSSPEAEHEPAEERSETLDAALNALEAQLHSVDTEETAGDDDRAHERRSDTT